MQRSRISRLTWCCVGLLALCQVADAAAPPLSDKSLVWRPEFRTPRGYLARGDLYAIRTRVDPDDEYVNLYIHISKAPVSPKPSAKSSVSRYKRVEGRANYQMHGPLRWRIHGGTYWENASGASTNSTAFAHVLLDDLKYFDPIKPIDIDVKEFKTSERVYQSYWFLEPLDSLIRTVTQAEAARRYDQPGRGYMITVEGIDYDLLPVGEKEGLLFVRHEERMRVLRGVYTGRDSQPDGGNVKWVEAKADGFAVPFAEPFQVYGDRDDWQFLTRGGSLYRSRKPAKGPRKLELEYASRDKPLRALLTDSATNKTFAFIAAPESPKGNYFELSAGPKAARPYTLPDAKPDAALDEPLRSLMGYARVLLADKKIEGKRPAGSGAKKGAKP